MPVLSRPFALHDIRDSEAFAARIIQRSRLELSYYDHEDLLAYLVETAWELSLRYRRGNPDFPARFSVYATNILRRRVVDWQRQRDGRTRWQFAGGRTYERPRPQFQSLDADDGDRDRLERALGPRAGDPADDCGPDLGRVVGERRRSRAQDYAALGLEPPGRAA